MNEVEINGDLFKQNGSLVFVGEGVSIELFGSIRPEFEEYKLENNTVVPDLNEISATLLVDPNTTNRIEEDVNMIIAGDKRANRYVKGYFENIPIYTEYKVLDEESGKICTVEKVIGEENSTFNIKETTTNKIKHSGITYDELSNLLQNSYSPIVKIE